MNVKRENKYSYVYSSNNYSSNNYYIYYIWKMNKSVFFVYLSLLV